MSSDGSPEVEELARTSPAPPSASGGPSDDSAWRSRVDLVHDGAEDEAVADLQPLLRAATRTLAVSLGVMLVWLYTSNMVVKGHGPFVAFFKIVDGINTLVMGAMSVLAIGAGIGAIYVLTTLFTQTITNLYSVRLLEDIAREHLFHGDLRGFLSKLLNFGSLPQPPSPFPTSVTATLFVFAYHYVIAWFYLVVFSECLWFAAWSAGVYLELFPETMQIVPLFAIAVPFTARLMAYFEYPYADDYAAFIPGILFVVVLLLVFVGYMGGSFEYFMVDIYQRELPGFFQEGALFWRFLLDGCEIAFYPVFGEVVFFFLQYQRLKRRETRLLERIASRDPDDERAGRG